MEKNLKGKYMKLYKWFGLLIGCIVLSAACSDDDKNFGELGVTIETPVASDTTSSSIQLKATLEVANDVVLSKRGFCYSTNENPDIYSATVVADGDKIFAATIDGLLVNTTYYIRAFVVLYNGGVAY